ncbi:MAG: hypothetical protein E7415_01715 [Ruminococcaceae bacterium]|nr:hypothetical protein [Oscillospiraceae bacterium]
MKKIISLILFFCCILNIIPICADEIESDVTEHDLIKFGILDEDSFLNDDTITREECLIAIMRVIGLTDNDVNMMDGADCYAFVDVGPFTYIGCAWESRIAYGIECIVDFPTYRSSHTGKNTDYFFFSDRDATITEALAFMIRCLEKDEIDLDMAIEKAYQYGLLRTEDVFSEHLDSKINQRDFSILLDRLLQQKRCKYYEAWHGIGHKIDEERSISYIDMHNQRLKNGGVIPDEETALVVGKAILEKYTEKPLEHETEDKIYYLEVEYLDQQNAWRICQTFRYKDENKGWSAGGKFYRPYVVISKQTGEVLSINTYSSFGD